MQERIRQYKLNPSKAPPLQDREIIFGDLMVILSCYDIIWQRRRRGSRLFRKQTRTIFPAGWVRGPQEKMQRSTVSAIRRRFCLTPTHGVTNEDFYTKLKPAK
jgi:hypothetical protein